MARSSGFVLLAMVAVTLINHPRLAHADCDTGADYQSSVFGNTVTVCLVSQSEVTTCSASHPVVRQNIQTSETVGLGAFCLGPDAGLPGGADVAEGFPCFVDECVPQGSYRYGLAPAYDCSQAGCGAVALFTEAAVTSPLPATCVRSDGNTAPTTVTQTPPWGSGEDDAGSVTGLKNCPSGCSLAASGRQGVLSANAAAVLIGGILLLVRLRRKALRA